MHVSFVCIACQQIITWMLRVGLLFWRAINIKFGHANSAKLRVAMTKMSRPLHWPHLPPRLWGLDFEPVRHKFLATPLRRSGSGVHVLELALDFEHTVDILNTDFRCGAEVLPFARTHTWQSITCVPIVDTYRVGQIKWHHFTFLLVTHECIHKILWFLAHINYIMQKMKWC